jgi:hypothetical protein
MGSNIDALRSYATNKYMLRRTAIYFMLLGVNEELIGFAVSAFARRQK